MKAILTGNDGEQEIIAFDMKFGTLEDILGDIIFDYLRRRSQADYHNEDTDLVEMWANWPDFVSVRVEQGSTRTLYNDAAAKE